MRTSEAKRNFSLQLHERCLCFEKKAFAKERRVFFNDFTCQHIIKDEYDFAQKSLE